MFHAMNQSKQDLQVGLQRQSALAEARMAQLEQAKNRELQWLRSRAEQALQEAEERHRRELQQLARELEAERTRSNAERYRCESLQASLAQLRQEQMRAPPGADVEVRRLRETTRHLREQLDASEAELRTVKRQLDESLSSQYRQRDSSRWQSSRAEPDLEEELPDSSQWQSADAMQQQQQQYSSSGAPDAPAWSHGGDGFGHQQSFGDPMATQPFGDFSENKPDQTFDFASTAQWGSPTEDFKPSSTQESLSRRKKHKEKKSKSKKDDSGYAWQEQPQQQPPIAFEELPAAPPGAKPEYAEAVAALKGMGFPEDRLTVVLEAVGGDVEKAVPVLLSEM